MWTICTKSGVTKISEDGYYNESVSHENLSFECTDEVSGFTETSNNLGNCPYPNCEWNGSSVIILQLSVQLYNLFIPITVTFLQMNKWIILYSV